MTSLLRNNLLLLIMGIVGCMPKEEPVQPYDRGDVEVQFIDVGKDKTDVIFYSLERGNVIARAKPSDWDLYVAENGIRINYHRFMQYAPMVNGLNKTIDTIGLSFNSGQLDSNQYTIALGEETVINLATDENGNHLGFIKFVANDLNGEVELMYAKLDTDQFKTLTLKKGDYVNLRTDSIVDLPDDNEYDLSFGKYLNYFEVEMINYEVFGALTPGLRTIETGIDFSAIDLASTNDLSWSNRFDVIGYDWKYYSLDKGAYSIDETKNYVITSTKGFVYKLRFVNFYNTDGTSGYPTFEYKLL